MNSHNTTQRSPREFILHCTWGITTARYRECIVRPSTIPRWNRSVVIVTIFSLDAVKSCQKDNFRRNKWRKRSQKDNISVSALQCVPTWDGATDVTLFGGMPWWLWPNHNLLITAMCSPRYARILRRQAVSISVIQVLVWYIRGPNLVTSNVCAYVCPNT